MAYQKKRYRNGQSRGGIKGQACDTSFGSPRNLNKSKKNYRKQ